MRATHFTFFILMASPLLGQTFRTSVDFQQPSWVGSPDASTITVHITQPAAQSGPVLERAFSATEVRHSQQVLADGTHLDHSDTSRFYRDAQGRMRDEGSNVAIVYDPTIDATYTLHLKEKIYDQWSAGGHHESTTIAAFGSSSHIDTPGNTGPVEHAKWGEIPYHSEPVSHMDTEQLGEQSVNGVQCKGTRVTIVIPAKTVGNDHDIHVVNERWYSDELMALVKSSNDDPRFGVTTYELKDVTRGNPDPSRFRLPEGFTKSTRGTR